jgi:hypothetical protein
MAPTVRFVSPSSPAVIFVGACDVIQQPLLSFRRLYTSQPLLVGQSSYQPMFSYVPIYCTSNTIGTTLKSDSEATGFRERGPHPGSLLSC